MNITKHCRSRYVERIKGITNTIERNAYITTNMERIDEHIETMFSFAKFVYRGRIGGDGSKKSFYVHQDIAFVVADTDDTIVTIFKINFEFPADAKDYVINSLISQIQELDDIIAQEKAVIQEETARLDTDKEKNSLEIADLEERVKLLKARNKHIDDEKALLLQETAETIRKQERFAIQLFSNSEYKADVKDKDWK